MIMYYTKGASQNEIIMEHLKIHGSITTYEAYNRYHITRLPARIHELKKKGVEIVKTERPTKSRGAAPCSRRYSLTQSCRF